MFFGIVEKYFDFKQHFNCLEIWNESIFKIYSNNHLSLCDEKTPKKHFNK